jgi:hypothetical protein
MSCTQANLSTSTADVRAPFGDGRAPRRDGARMTALASHAAVCTYASQTSCTRRVSLRRQASIAAALLSSDLHLSASFFRTSSSQICLSCESSFFMTCKSSTPLRSHCNAAPRRGCQPLVRPAAADAGGPYRGRQRRVTFVLADVENCRHVVGQLGAQPRRVRKLLDGDEQRAVQAQHGRALRDGGAHRRHCHTHRPPQ